MHTKPFFLPVDAGALYCLHFEPTAAAREGPALLHCPALGEEMNRSRKMVAMQARALARAGLPVLVVDLHGTGDSAGSFGDATWARWIDDLAAARDWLRARGHEPVWLWGHRAGCLLAGELAARFEPDPVVLWQPVLRGATWLTQLLRLRSAAAMMGDEKVDVKALRAELLAGQALEVAGYEVSPGLARGLESATLGAIGDRARSIAWVEVSSGDPPRVAPAGARLIESLTESGNRVEVEAVAGEPFWTTQEIAVAPAMVEATLELLSRFEGWGGR